jgi:uncharacterized membrane protein
MTNIQTQISTEKNKKGTVGGRYHPDDISRYAVTIGRPQAEVFRFWRNFENLAQFMKDVESVEVLSDKKSRWEIQIKSGPFKNRTATWDAEIVKERAFEMISWKTLPDSEVQMTGSIWFSPAPAGRGTIVSLDMDISPPGGKLTEFVTAFTGESPNLLIQNNLARFKALMETGEVPTTEGQSSGREENSEIIRKH